MPARNSEVSGAMPSMTRVRILCISGSLRRDSYNWRLLQAAGELASVEAELVLWEQLKVLPPFDEDDEPTPPAAVRAFREAIDAAGALLIATPEYNASVPGQLKNALDWASRPYETNVLRGKPVAVIGASPGRSGAAGAQAELRTVLTRIGAQVLKGGFTLPHAVDQFDQHGSLVPAHQAPLRQVLARLTRAAQQHDQSLAQALAIAV